MIEKERLQELIKQGATIWHIDRDFEVLTIYELNEDKIQPTNLDYILYIIDQNVLHELLLEDLFETKEDAEWELEFGNITRTETLRLPSFENFLIDKFLYFISKRQNKCCLYYLNVSNKIAINVSSEVIELGDLTKENYIEACRLAKKLFLGEK